MPSNDAAEEENLPDIIPSILNGSPFKIRPDNEKLTILQKGRPQPKLIIVKRDTSRNCNRTFQPSWYDIHKWLCGSKNYNKLFCWPCLLMRPESSSWCSTGNDDMKRFSSLASKHSICKSHSKAISEYDATLIGFGLPAEYVNESTFKCKEEEEEASDQSDSEEDLFNEYFSGEPKPKTKTASQIRTKAQEQTSSKNEGGDLDASKIKGSITFKAWKEINKDALSARRSLFLDDFKLYKWKKKIAKQELKNARLTAEKLKFEIEVLKAKADYYKSLGEDVGKAGLTNMLPVAEIPPESHVPVEVSVIEHQ